MMSINNCMKNNIIYSFDIFDTLIYRNLPKPTDVFSLVEAKYNSMYKRI